MICACKNQKLSWNELWALESKVKFEKMEIDYAA